MSYERKLNKFVIPM